MSSNAPPGGGNAPIVHVVSKSQTQQQEAVVEKTPEQIAAETAATQQNPPVQQTVPDPNALQLEQKVETPPAQQTEASDFGDVGLNVAAEYFVGLGLAIDGRELTEAGKGNFALLEAKLELLGDKAKGSAGYVSLAKQGIANIENAAKAKGEAATKDVYDAVGGQANWEAVKQWAVTNLPKEELEQASAALGQGGFVAKAAATILLQRASGSSSVTVQGQSATNPNAATQALVAPAPLTSAEYRAEYRKLLVAKGGIKAAANSPELQALNRRLKR